MTRVHFHHAAEVELWQATAFYEQQSRGLGLRFVAEVERVVEIVRRFPDIGSPGAGQTRRCLLQRFPFLLVYTRHEQDVWILALAHCKRHPRTWQGRRPPGGTQSAS